MTKLTSWGLVIALSTASPAVAASLPNSCPSLQFESIPELPSGWKYQSAPDRNTPVALQVAIKQPHHDYLRIAREVSDPQSVIYGQHLSKAQLLQAMPDLESSASLVQDWLYSKGISSTFSEIGGWVKFNATIEKAESLLAAKYGYYDHNGSERALRTTAYSIPECLADVVDFVWPTTQFLTSAVPVSQTTQRLETRQAGGDEVNCTTDTCPSYLKKHYNITYSPPDKASGSKLGIAGFLGNVPDHEDFKSFLKSFGLSNDTSYLNYSFSVQSVNGGDTTDTPSTASVESMLDIGYSSTFIIPLDTTFFSTGGSPPTWSQPGNVSVPASQSENEPYLDLINYLLAMDDPPQVISMSYTDDEQTVPPSYAERVCNGFGALAARGVTVLAASGDGGAAGTSYGTCEGPNGEERFIPTFPASCPWVTSVGGLAAWGGAESWSSGGFSNYFATPSWQTNSTASYLEILKNDTSIPASYYNASGRGIPDLSLAGTRFPVITNGQTTLQKGTSASTPLLAGLLVLINDIRLRAGKPAIGFLNPLLYSAQGQASLRDVTEFNIGGCELGKTPVNGYDASVGWDPASGLGDVNFESLRALLG
ncbi:Tripeptidyl-peptidase sed2 [Cytospora mali]|uniref:tripeptidyl-peptidase II n=1 Tax=Cytospora mali TaxID=578113 RepID=A0A194VNE3_CYTMA|nr:Tripeptidyl-peptidase sed2 [Valsa mali]